jgi:hypothetical protein
MTLPYATNHESYYAFPFEIYMHLNRKIEQVRVELSPHLFKYYTLKTYGIMEV